MWHRVLADAVMIIHLAWIIFMLAGFYLTVRAFWRPGFLERWFFRSVHLAGIIFVALLEILGEYCPLTVWENSLRRSYGSNSDYPGSFIIGWIEKLIYPDVSPLVVLVPTIIMAGFTLVVFILRPPSKFKRH